MTDDPRPHPILALRVPLTEVVDGRAYVLLSREAGVGVAHREGDSVAYAIRRVKWERPFLTSEVDWEDPEDGSAIPLRVVDLEPPKPNKPEDPDDREDEEALMAWLCAREEETRPEWEAAQTEAAHLLDRLRPKRPGDLGYGVTEDRSDEG